MTVIQIPLTTEFKNRNSSVEKDAKIVNGYAEGLTQEAFQMRKRYGTLPIENIVVVKRPGYGDGVTYLNGTVQGITTYNGVVRLVINNKFYKTVGVSVDIAADGLPVEFS